MPSYINILHDSYTITIDILKKNSLKKTLIKKLYNDGDHLGTCNNKDLCSIMAQATDIQCTEKDAYNLPSYKSGLVLKDYLSNTMHFSQLAENMNTDFQQKKEVTL